MEMQQLCTINCYSSADIIESRGPHICHNILNSLHKKVVLNFTYCNIHLAIYGAELLKYIRKVPILNQFVSDYEHMERIQDIYMHFNGNSMSLL
jgi:hypothetical protein